MFLLLVVFGYFAFVVIVRKSTDTKAVRVGFLKDLKPLSHELHGLVIKAGLWEVTKVRVPVRPVLDTSNILEVCPSDLWVLSLKFGPDLLILPKFNRVLPLFPIFLKPHSSDAMGLECS